MRGYAVGIALVLMALPSSRANADEVTAEKAALHSKLGKMAFAEGDFAECVVQFQKSNESKEMARNHFNLGLCHERLEQFEDAVVAFRAYLTIEAEGDRAGEALTRIELLELKLGARPRVSELGEGSENEAGTSGYSPTSGVRAVVQGNFMDHALANGFGFAALGGWEVIKGYVGIRPGARLDYVILEEDSGNNIMFHAGLDIRISAHVTPHAIPYLAGGIGFSSLKDGGETESGSGFQVSGGVEVPLFGRYAIGVAASKHLGAIEVVGFGLALSRN